ncbi:hypothetical protein EW146_g686 [Bondarzewia mesenterica]|uniref:Peptidase M48 domain-containing protein n=1 Tax=Bondarzewia mesenterica TaxID=1095465 RepID=A0A4S4M7L1_9AGAM|nr:hypothetical protein EW146_g686 [Bondarzewia mesenterica]
MFSSIFSTSPPVDPKAPTFHPVSSRYPADELFGELEPQDTEWLCAGGFVTETQIWYNILEDGTSVMCQVIHSSIGVWYPTIQFTCKIFNPKTGESVWRSVNVSNFVTPPPGLDKRSSKADQFTITHKSHPDSDFPESYSLSVNLSNDFQVSLEIRRPASVPGYKVGKGPEGGYSYFGADPKKADGYVIHRFWPRDIATGHIILDGKAMPIEGPGMFVHAIQGMRPNLVASRWNFAHFQSQAHGGVSAIQMEFTTIDAYGRKGSGSGFATANIGSLVIGGKLVTVTAETKWPGETQAENAEVISRAVHLKPVHDPDTGYAQPTELLFRWAGPSLLPDAPGKIDGTISVEVGDPASPKGLIEKVDVLAEIPSVVKAVVSYVAGTKPYIYQWINPTKLVLTGPDTIVPDSPRQFGRSTSYYGGIRAPASTAGFHSTARNEALPFVSILAFFKASTALELARTAARVAFTLIPVLLLKNHRTRKVLRHVEEAKKKDPNATILPRFDRLVKDKGEVLRRMRRRTIAFHALLFTPAFLFWAAIVASMERTPLTGRWRLILISPEEEQDISSQLAGSGWYQAVGDIIAADGPPKIIPPSDWRYAWVRDTLRRLESAIPTLGIEQTLEPAWLERGPDDVPLPPPADFPLRPRPRASEYIHLVCQLTNSRPVSTTPHIIPGPPYSLVVVDRPDACNAFSYGFGPDGAGGLVVFSGFLDQIMKRHPPSQATTTSNLPQSEETSWWQLLFGSFLSVTPPVQQYQPTPEQTSDLAILLAHELAHLVLSHHLETLSSKSVILPGMLSFISDFVRTLIFPVTMLFGPFVNDAVAQMGKVGSRELTKLGEYCTSETQEIEADVVSARRSGGDRERNRLVMKIMGSGHPVNELRVKKLRDEIERWRAERLRVLTEIKVQAQADMDAAAMAS